MGLGRGRREERGRELGLIMGGGHGGGCEEGIPRWTIEEVLPCFFGAAVVRMLEFVLLEPMKRGFIGSEEDSTVSWIPPRPSIPSTATPVSNHVSRGRCDGSWYVRK